MKEKLNAKNILCIILVVLYFVGLILMITGRLGQGISCWVISTIGGLLVLGLMKRKEERAEAEAEAQRSKDKTE